MLNRPSVTAARQYTLAIPYPSSEDLFLAALREDSPDLWSANSLTSLDDARVHVRSGETAKVVVLMDSPIRRIASLLSKGLPASSSLLKWEQETQEILEMKRQLPEQLSVLLMAEGPWPTQFIPSPRGGAEVVPSSEAGASVLPNFTPGTRWTLPAVQLLATPGTSDVLEELHEIATVLGEEPTPLAVVEQALTDASTIQSEAEHRDKQVSTLQLRLKKSRQEGSALLKELHRTQEQLEQTIRQGMKLAREKTRAEKASAHHKRIRDRQERKIEALRQSREHHMAKVQALQERIKHRPTVPTTPAIESQVEAGDGGASKLKRTVDRQEKLIAALRKETTAQEAELKKTSAELKRVKNSRSWKYTRLIRRLNGTE